MISLEEALLVHEYLVETFGGPKGIRDMDLLQFALHRPFLGT